MLNQNQINQIVDELKEDARIIGILVTGSYIYGIPNDESDLDVRCIVSDGTHIEEKERVRFGIKVELFFNSYESIRFYMKQGEDEGHGAAIHFWAHGKIAYDPQGIAARLQQEARDWWRNGRTDGQPWEPRQEKYRKYT